MLTKKQFKSIVDIMVEDYGVRSYLNNIEDDMTQEEIDEDLWFECPECGEPILYDDYADEIEVMNDEDGSGDYIFCPICEDRIEVVLDAGMPEFTIEMECEFYEDEEED